MILAMVVGTVVSRERADGLEAPAYLLVERCDQQGTGKRDFLVALDLIGAGYGEVVLLSQGSAARQTPITDDRPIDAAIVGIVDLIDQENKVLYRK